MESIIKIFEKILKEKQKIYNWSFYLNRLEELENDNEKEIYKIILYIMELKYNLENKKLISLEQTDIFDKIYGIKLNDEVIVKLLDFDFSKLPLEIKAKLNLFLWENSKKNIENAQKAIQEYYDLYTKYFNVDNWIDCFEYFKIVIKLCNGIKDNDIAIKYLEKCFNSLLALNGEDSKFLSLRMINLFLDINYSKSKKLEPLIDKIISEAVAARDTWKVENAYAAKINYLKYFNKKEVETTYINLAKYYEYILKLNDKKYIHQNITNLNKALKIYKKFNTTYKNDIERIKKLLLDEAKKMPEIMYVTKYEFDMAHEKKFCFYLTQMLNKSQCISFLINEVRFLELEKLKEELKDSIREAPMAYLLSNSLLDENGRCIYVLPGIREEDEHSINNYLYKMANFEESFIGDTALRWILEYINKNFKIELNDLDFIVKDNLLISEDRRETIKFALYLGFTGKLYEALQILVLQMENCFRNLVELLGGVPYIFNDDGSSDVKTIGSLLEMDEIKECIEEDIVFGFKELLNEKAGANIRNKIAHGIFTKKEAESGSGLFLFCIIIRFLTYFSRSGLERFFKDKEIILRGIDSFQKADMKVYLYFVQFVKIDNDDKVQFKFLDFDDLSGQANNFQEARREAQKMLYSKIKEYNEKNIKLPVAANINLEEEKTEIISVVL